MARRTAKQVMATDRVIEAVKNGVGDGILRGHDKRYPALEQFPVAAPGKTWGYRRVHVQATTPDGLVWRFTLHQDIPNNIWQLVRAENVPVQISVSGVVQP